MQFSLSKLFQFVIAISTKHNIDESHGLGHSMRVFQFAEQIAAEEPLYISNPVILKDHLPIIQAAAILHDTCDKKYREEKEGLVEIRDFLMPLMPDNQVAETIRIIENMSYSKVTKYGMPNLGNYQTAFNVVREADLLDAYDFDRSMIYHMQRNSKSIEDAYDDARKLFQNRVFRHVDDSLLITNYAIRKHPEFRQTAIARIEHWRKVIERTREIV
jgi:HD superfamily phosphodiesterase